MIQIPEHVQNLTPYKAGKPIEELAREKNLTRIVKLASNENPLGPSPKAVEAVKAACSELHRYTDPSCYVFRHAFAEHYGTKPENIVPASGSDALIEYIIAAFTTEEDEVLSSEGTFIGWYVNVNKLNRKSVLVPMKDYSYDLEAIANAITPKTKIIYLANPNNPTGTVFSESDFQIFMGKVPDSVLVILDEAYTIFTIYHLDYPNGLEYDYDNLIVLRTFSKDYGLAGLRLGVAFAKPYLIREIFKVKLPFEPSHLAQVGAIAALQDQEFIDRFIELHFKSMGRFKDAFDELGIQYTDSYANFFLLLFKDEETASIFNQGCLDRGLILRHVASFGIPNGVRINTGTEEETEFAIEVIKEVMSLLEL